MATQTLAVPEWLNTRGGSLRLGIDGHSWFVIFGVGPQYELTPVPVKGKFGCEIRQTVNGKRLDKGTVYASEDAAQRGGLEELRQALGW